MPRFEFENMMKTYIQDAHKPWSGHIQGETFYVGSPGFEFEHGPVRILMNAPEELRLRGLPFAQPFLPHRPLGVKPYTNFRRPFGIETGPPPYYDTGYTYPDEPMDVIIGPYQQPVGPNELPKYFGAIEGEAIGPTVDLEHVLYPMAGSPDWMQDFGAPVLGMPEMVPRPDVPFWGMKGPEDIGKCRTCEQMKAPSILDKLRSLFVRKSAPVRSSPMRPRRRVLKRQVIRELVCLPPCYRTAGGCMHDCPIDEITGVVAPCSTPCPPRRVSGQSGQSSDTQAGSAPRTAYGVTKVVDTIVQDYPQSDWPEVPEELAYMPENVIGPYGVSQPTISKSKETIGKKYYGASCSCSGQRKPKCRWPLVAKCRSMYGAGCMYHCLFPWQ